jgi:hypothetical protein
MAPAEGVAVKEKSATLGIVATSASSATDGDEISAPAGE